MAAGRDIFLCSGVVFVWGFFIMSGLLTFNSYIKTPYIKTFICKRMKRILPAYLLAVLLGFVAGMLLTTHSLSDFLVDPQTWKYLAANAVFLNYIQPTLPGVFEENAMPFINASLWTMKVEIIFYFSVPVVHWLLRRFGKNTVLLTIIVLSTVYNIATAELYAHTGNQIFFKLNHQVFSMLAFFYAPVLLLFNREFLSRHIVPLLVVSIPMVLCVYADEWVKYFLPIPFSVVLISFAYGVKKLHFVYRWKDYSYEFYLLRFPVIQVMLCLFGGMSFPTVFAVSLVVTAVLAVLMNNFLKRLMAPLHHNS